MLYWTIRALARAMVSALLRVEVSGTENVPGRGAFIVCSNHIAWLDPVVLAVVFQRKIAFMAKQELFRYPVFGWVLRRVGAFPVRRGAVDRGAIHSASRVLSSGGVLGMFPEGTRSRTGEIGKGHNGAAYLAVRNRVPVVPVGISGPYRVGGTVQVRIGKPIEMAPAGKRVSSKEMGGAGDAVMEAIVGLVQRRAQVAGSCR